VLSVLAGLWVLNKNGTKEQIMLKNLKPPVLGDGEMPEIGSRDLPVLGGGPSGSSLNKGSTDKIIVMVCMNQNPGKAGYSIVTLNGDVLAQGCFSAVTTPQAQYMVACRALELMGTKKDGFTVYTNDGNIVRQASNLDWLKELLRAGFNGKAKKLKNRDLILRFAKLFIDVETDEVSFELGKNFPNGSIREYAAAIARAELLRK
jgi:ribonuclease HI